VDNLPNKLEIDVAVALDQAVPHTDNGGPGDFRVILLEAARHFAGRFANDLDAANDGVLMQFAYVEPGLIEARDKLHGITSGL